MLANDRQVGFVEGVMSDQLILGVGHCEQAVTLGGGKGFPFSQRAVEIIFSSHYHDNELSRITAH